MRGSAISVGGILSPVPVVALYGLSTAPCAESTKGERRWLRGGWAAKGVAEQTKLNGQGGAAG